MQLSNMLTKLGEGVSTAASNIWELVWNKTFALITTVITVIAAPFTIAYFNAKSDRQSKVTSELMALIKESKQINAEETVRLELAASFIQENSGIFDMQTVKLAERLDARYKALESERNSQEEMKKLKATLDEKVALLAKQDENLLLLKEAEQRKLDLERKLKETEEKLKSANVDAAAKKEMEKTVEDLNNQLAGANEDRDLHKKKNSELEQQINNLISPPKPEIAEGSEPDAGGEPPGPAPTPVNPEHKTIAEAGSEVDQLQAKIKSLCKFIDNSLGGTWIYLGWRDKAGVLRELRVELQGNAKLAGNQTYTLTESMNVRRQPKKDSEKLYVVDKGYRIVVADIHNGNDVNVSGEDGVAVWGKVSEVSPPKSAWYKRIFGR